MSNNDLSTLGSTVGSTYAYLTVARLDEVSNRTDLQFTWRPKR